MSPEEKGGFITQVRRFFSLSPEQQAQQNLIKQVAAASVYYSVIVLALNHEGRYAKYSDKMRTELVLRLSQTWLDDHGSISFPIIDEFELTTGWIIKKTGYNQHTEHKRLTLSQLGTWIAEQKRELGIK